MICLVKIIKRGLLSVILTGSFFFSKEILSQGQNQLNFEYSDDLTWEKPEWENPEIFEINRENPKATFYSYKSSQKAIENDNWENNGGQNGYGKFQITDHIFHY